MAKPVILTSSDKQHSFDVTRIDRAKLYGVRKRQPLDKNGQPCTKGSLTLDGANLLLSGMTAQGYFNSEGSPISRQEMVGLDVQGNVVEQIPSTLGSPQKLEGPVSASEVLDLDVESFFCLEPLEAEEDFLAELKSGLVYKFSFNYSAGLEMETAYLVANDDGVFAIVGTAAPGDWVEEAAVYVPVDGEDSDSEDLDFEAL
jgi:hypothetical protein